MNFDFVTDWFLRWWLHRGRYGWSKMRRRLFERRYLSTPLPEAKSLSEIGACLEKVTWTGDGLLHLFDSISYPHVTWAKKKDDCDGFAILAAELLQRLNPDYKPLLLTALVHPIGKSHTVCVFVSDTGKLRVFDNYSLKAKEHDVYDSIIQRISQGSRKLVCWDVREPDTFVLVEFHRS